MKNNGLKLIKLNSKAIELPPINDVTKIISEHIKINSFVVAYMDYTVLAGRYENAKFIFYKGETLEQKYLQRIRVFNKTEELLIWRTGNEFKGRLRIDGDGENTDAVEAHQVLFGTDKKSLGDFTEIYEARGTKIILPFSDLIIDNKRKRIFIKTRNYIDYNEIHQATYVDTRFVTFTDDRDDLD
jgi:CRISPR-associated protein (TIGR03984 family)